MEGKEGRKRVNNQPTKSTGAGQSERVSERASEGEQIEKNLRSQAFFSPKSPQGKPEEKAKTHLAQRHSDALGLVTIAALLR
ncbi:hypothetical protein Baya_9860 [Bagarius yarrelli]|uniref:Uncharacterized protein n=1 Tax=Bagarius yarrelli TaxID=175774 RepID=A0A556U9M0_BAGYA|nr:hypothetical protein Baya_9860 [Bagarius yarrelli]